MSSFSRGMLFVRYRFVYYFARLCGKDIADATVSARCVLTQTISRVINARTQSLAKHICTNH